LPVDNQCPNRLGWRGRRKQKGCAAQNHQK